MKGGWRRIRGALLVASIVGLVSVPETNAWAGRGGGHGGGGGGHAHAPRMSAAHQSFKAPKMPRAAAPARSSVARAQTRTSNTGATAHANNAQSRTNNGQTRASLASSTGTKGTTGTRAMTGTRATTGTNSAGTNTATSTGTNTATTNTGVNNTGTLASTNSPNNYTYGTGSSARNYRAYGYGRGYRNAYSGGRSGYGRSQSNNRGVVARLRSAHRALSRIDADYNGHRARAMHSISMAIRQLSHRSMVFGNAGMTGGMNNINNNNRAMQRRMAGFNGNAGGRRNMNGNRRMRMPQAQSDAVMSQVLRTLQGVNMQLSSQGSNTSGHARARGHVRYAMRELNEALSIR